MIEISSDLQIVLLKWPVEVRRMSPIRITVVAFGLLALVAPVNAQAPKTRLPAAVEAAFKKAYPNATIKNSSSEKEDGKLQYEIESMDGKTNRDLVYLADGTSRSSTQSQ